MDGDTSVSQVGGFITLCEIALLVESAEQPRKKRKMWCASILDRRDDQGIANNLVKEMRLEDADSYRNFLRMSPSVFSWLLEKVTPIIQKRDTNMRSAISAHDRLAVTLRYLATGESRSSLHFQFRMGRSTVSGIITEVCEAITHVLAPYISVPSKTEEWLQVATQFWQLWNFPLCLGAMDGKHVAIRPPSHSGSHFFNYKGSFSVVLFALVDANLNFLYVDVGTNGRISDGGVYAKSRLKGHIDGNTLNMPERADLPDTNINVPFTILADDAFPLTKRLMKPYPQRGQTKKQRIFNYRLSRARRVVENAFGILASRFQVYRRAIETTIPNVNQIVLATCSLHNLLRKIDKNLYTPIGFTDSEDVVETTVKLGDWRNSANGFLNLESEGRRPSQEALWIRNLLCDYFSGRGSVSWQDDMISK